MGLFVHPFDISLSLVFVAVVDAFFSVSCSEDGGIS